MGLSSISCLDDEDTIIRALETGGDDFLAKPFNNKVLQARIDANLRRVAIERKKQYTPPRRSPDFTLDMSTRVLTRDGKDYPLTPIEFGLLYYLMEHEGQVISSRELYEYVWAQPDLGDLRTVVAHAPSVAVRLFPPHHGRSIATHAVSNESVSVIVKSSVGIPSGKERDNRHKCYPFTLGKARNIKGLQAHFRRKENQSPSFLKTALKGLFHFDFRAQAQRTGRSPKAAWRTRRIYS